jgi:hypothetical protein
MLNLCYQGKPGNKDNNEAVRLFGLKKCLGFLYFDNY